MKNEVPHCSLDGDWSCSLPKLRYSDGGRLLQLSFAQSPAARWNGEQFYSHERKRGVCKGFSFSSRRRMLNNLNSLSVNAPLPCFVTLTFPDSEFNDSVTIFARQAKRHLDAWLKRLSRVCPSAAGFWRMEWESRKSGLHVGKLFPHFHLLLWGLPVRALSYKSPSGQDLSEFYVPVRESQLEFGIRDVYCSDKPSCDVEEGSEDKMMRAALKTPAGRFFLSVDLPASLPDGHPMSWMSFQSWGSLAWYHVVGSGNTAHFEAGFRSERVRSWGGVMSYCSKYMAKLGENNFLSDVSIGRSWGFFNRSAIPWAKLMEIDLDERVGVRLRRVMRHYMERVRGRRCRFPYGVTLYCDVSRFKALWAPPPDCPF